MEPLSGYFNFMNSGFSISEKTQHDSSMRAENEGGPQTMPSPINEKANGNKRNGIKRKLIAKMNGQADTVNMASSNSALNKRQRKIADKNNKEARLALELQAQEKLQRLIEEARQSNDPDRLREIAETCNEYKVLWALAKNPNVTPDIAAVIIPKVTNSLDVICMCFSNRLEIINDDAVFDCLKKRYPPKHPPNSLKIFKRILSEYIDANPVGIRPEILQTIKDEYSWLLEWHNDLAEKIDNYPGMQQQFQQGRADGPAVGMAQPYQSREDLLNKITPRIFEELRSSEIGLPLVKVMAFWDKFKKEEWTNWKQSQLGLHPDKYLNGSEEKIIAGHVFCAANKIMQETWHGNFTLAEIFNQLS